MRPGWRSLLILVPLLLAAVLAAAANLLEWADAERYANAVWLGLVAVGLISGLDLVTLRRPELEVDRELDPHLALGVRQKVLIRISNRDTRRLRFWVTDFAPAQIQMDGLPVAVRLGPQENLKLRYRVIPRRRGPAEFGRVGCRVLSNWGIWEKTYYYAEPQQARVYPNYKPLFRSSFIGSEQLYVDLGLQLRQRRGEGTDFHQLRDFRVGDSLRQVDWRATARFRKPISREYQEERDQQVVFLLDCGRRMRARDGEISHFDHALNALLVSAFVALRQGDSVGLLSFAGQPRWVAPVKGRHQVTQLLDQVYDLDSAAITSDYLDVARQLLSRQSRRSLVILISSLEPQDSDDLVQAARLMSRHHLVMVASMRQQVLTDTLAADVVSIDDALKYCGVSRHLQEQAAMYAQLRSDNVIVADTVPAQMHATLITEYMALKRSGLF